MGKRYFERGYGGLYWVWDMETCSATWVVKKDLSFDQRSDFKITDDIIQNWKEIPDPTKPVYFQLNRNGKGVHWDFGSNIDHGKIEGGQVYWFENGKYGPAGQYGWTEASVTNYFKTKRWIEVPESEVFPPKDRFFGNHDEPLGRFWMIKSDGSEVYVGWSTGVESRSIYSLVELSGRQFKEFSASSKEDAIRIRFPKKPEPVVVARKPRYFHLTNQGTDLDILWIVDGDQKVSVVGSDGEKRKSYTTFQSLIYNLTGQWAEFYPKSEESAIRSRLFALKYNEGKAKGIEEGYLKAKKEFDTKIADVKNTVLGLGDRLTRTSAA